MAAPLRLLRQDTGAVVVESLEVADTSWTRFKGLQWRRGLPAGSGLLLVPCPGVHTGFMRFPIDVVLLDRRGVVLAVQRQVEPWHMVMPAQGSYAVLEVPAGSCDLQAGVALRLDPAGQACPRSLAFLTQGQESGIRGQGSGVRSQGPEDYHQAVSTKLLLLACLAGTVFLNSLIGIFTPDEERSVLADPQLLHPGPATWLSSQRLVNATWLLNRLVPQSRMGYHLVNLAIHILAGLTLFGIVCRTLMRQQDRPRWQQAAPWLALLIAALWMLHPLQTQSVTHISGRGEALAALCYLLTLYGLVRGAEAESSWPWYGLSVLACALGMGSSPVLVTAPILALLFDRTYLSGSFTDLGQRRAGLYAALAACWGLLALPLFAPAPATEAPPLATYLLTQPGVVLHYLRLVVWPVGLSVDYADYPLAQGLDEVWPGVAVLAVLLAATTCALLRWPRVGFLGAWFLLTLLPASLVSSPVLVNESRMDLPLAAVSAGVVLAGFALVLALGEKQAWVMGTSAVLAVVLVAALGTATFLRNYDHASALDLWRQTVAVRPGNVRVHLYLGNAFFEARQFGQAAPEFQTFLETPASDRAGQDMREQVLVLLGLSLMRDNKLDEAVSSVSHFSSPDADQSALFNNLGYNAWSNKEYAGAVHFFTQAVQLRPAEPKYHFNLALALKQSGDKKNAELALKEGLRLAPSYPKTAREQAWQKATDADPAGHTMLTALQALFLAEQANLASPAPSPEVLDTLAAAYANGGRYPDAVKTAKEAHKLATAQKNRGLATQIHGRLLLYEQGKPYHQPPAPNTKG
jgi:tetratricopeptide (TPR) repeat protein/uncharacterized membrane protein (UPF0127 family)